MPFYETYVDPAVGSNLNGGSSAGAATATYVSSLVGGWNATTGVFEVASGNPVSDGVAVGMLASVYVTAGATVATFVARITACTATTITVSLFSVSGTPPATDVLGATTMKVGGAWAGPSEAVAFPFNFVSGAMTNSSSHTPRVNLKNATTYSITAAMTHAVAGPVRFQGYTSTVNDGGRAIIDGGTSGASYVLLTVSGVNTDLTNLIFQNNGATGSAGGVEVSGTECFVRGCVFNSVRGCGLSFTAAGVASECEAYACNQSNTASFAGFRQATTGGTSFIRCISHDNAGSNSSGFLASVQAKYSGCVADTNGSHGFSLTMTTLAELLNCDAYNNSGDGISLNNASSALFYIENCNLVKNGVAGISGSGAGARNGRVINCGFGSGTQANSSGTTTGLKSMTEAGSVTYPTDATPWVAPLTGNFCISLAAAKGTGCGTFTQTQAGYSGTVGYPDIGAGQHIDDGTLNIPSISGGMRR